MNEFQQDYKNELNCFIDQFEENKAVDILHIFDYADLIRVKYENEFMRNSDANEYLIFLQIATTIYFEQKKL